MYLVRMSNVVFIIFLTFVFLSRSAVENNDEIIIDSNLSFAEAVEGTKAPLDVINKLILLDIVYYSTDGKQHQGQLIIHKDVKTDIEDMFEMMLEMKFVIEKIIPINKYNWSDDKSMRDNNTSAFNYRYIAGTKRLSNHSFGRAVDINPRWNPVIHKDGRVSPKNGKYDLNRPGTFSTTHPIVMEFKKRGWRWGGDFSKYKDNHHFDLPSSGN